MIRAILGVIAGLAAGTLVILLIEIAGHRLYPFPPGLDPKDEAALRAFMMTAPVGAWMVLLCAYALGSFTGGAVGTLIVRKAWGGWAIGAIFTALGLVNLMSMPHPAWLWSSLAVYLPCAWLGAKLTRRRQPAA